MVHKLTVRIHLHHKGLASVHPVTHMAGWKGSKRGRDRKKVVKEVEVKFQHQVTFVDHY